MDWLTWLPLVQVGSFFAMLGVFLTILSRERKYHLEMRQDLITHAEELREQIDEQKEDNKELRAGLKECRDREQKAEERSATLERRISQLEGEVRSLTAAAAHATGRVEGAQETAAVLGQFVGQEISRAAGVTLEAIDATAAADANP